MRALLLCLIGLTAASLNPALAQMKLSPKAAPGAGQEPTRQIPRQDFRQDQRRDRPAPGAPGRLSGCA